MAFKTERTDLGLKKVIREMEILGRIKVEAGSLGGQRRERSGEFGLGNATVLAIHEFGGGNVPARAPIKRGLANAARLIKKVFRSGVEKINAGSSGAEAAMDAVGEVAKQAIKDGIKSSLPPPLSPATLAKPDRDPRGIPLLDTEQLIDSIGAKAMVK